MRIGSTLEHSYNFDAPFCMGPCTALQQTQEPGPTKLSLTAPVNGTITDWSVRGGEQFSIFTLRILRPAGGLTYTFAGTYAALPSGADGSDTIRTFYSSAAIKQGDAIGLQTPGGTAPPMHNGPPASPNDVVAYTPLQGSDGGSRLFTNMGGESKEVLLQATIRYCKVPNVIGKRERAVKEAMGAADCAARIATKDLNRRKKKNRKRHAKVIRQNFPPGTVLEPGSQVGVLIALARRKP